MDRKTQVTKNTLWLKIGNGRFLGGSYPTKNYLTTPLRALKYFHRRIYSSKIFFSEFRPKISSNAIFCLKFSKKKKKKKKKKKISAAKNCLQKNWLLPKMSAFRSRIKKSVACKNKTACQITFRLPCIILVKCLITIFKADEKKR